MSDSPRLSGGHTQMPGLGGGRGARLLVASLTEASKRPAAIQRLIEIGEPAVPSLLDALSHRSRHVRDAAAYTLGKIGSRAAVFPLIAVLRDPEPAVRKIAAYALGAIEDVRALPALIALLRDRDNQVVDAAVYALSRIDLPDGLVKTIEAWAE
ncbi:MAG: HEAT repeat domain-containing protein [Chloroflexi bacterium]|nr:HEAT repeat domain-containing protein [Chloroflexota bacterium]